VVLYARSRCDSGTRCNRLGEAQRAGRGARRTVVGVLVWVCRKEVALEWNERLFSKEWVGCIRELRRMTADLGAGGSEFYGKNRHVDVLGATPSSAEERSRLVDELKRRGNAAFAAKSLPEANMLYSKAIEHDSSVAALFGNRSMVHLTMGDFGKALSDAQKAVELDPDWAKGHFRVAKALAGLGRFDEAEKSFRKVLELDEKNEAAQKEVTHLPELKKKFEAEQERKRKIEAEKVAEKKAKESVVSKKIVEVNEDNKKKENGPKEKKDKEEIDWSLRGYRKTADGRVTTYFNREISDEAKELLKNNKPREVDEEALKMQEMAEETAKKGGSAWNYAKTFEERDMSAWAKPRLKELLTGVSVQISLKDVDGDMEAGEMEVTELKSLEGDASITFTRGKRRHIFDFAIDVAWKVMCEGKKISGTIFLPDISGDSVSGDPTADIVEAELRWNGRTAAGVNEAAISSALMDKDPKKGLLGALHVAVHQFAAEFRKMN